ncbi:hypothetical protein XELAEV_18017630mg [Xenopus laevis]|uniref:Uncharacterized protein n=1 Tax=Xenopus laevis TaxID=8355 RepID=A0A974DBV5_XENLA|nr:hypothetical protein XELAEV_18017630mg [Xenopus laevis]
MEFGYYQYHLQQNAHCIPRLIGSANHTFHSLLPIDNTQICIFCITNRLADALKTHKGKYGIILGHAPRTVSGRSVTKRLPLP